jgi:hypothetical protein
VRDDGAGTGRDERRVDRVETGMWVRRIFERHNIS